MSIASRTVPDLSLFPIYIPNILTIKTTGSSLQCASLCFVFTGVRKYLTIEKRKSHPQTAFFTCKYQYHESLSTVHADLTAALRQSCADPLLPFRPISLSMITLPFCTSRRGRAWQRHGIIMADRSAGGLEIAWQHGIEFWESLLHRCLRKSNKQLLRHMELLSRVPMFVVVRSMHVFPQIERVGLVQREWWRRPDSCCSNSEGLGAPLFWGRPR